MHPNAGYMGTAYADTVKADQPHVLERFDAELERFAMRLDNLQKQLDPLTTRYASAEARLSEPKPEPASQLRGRVERLSELVTRLDAISGDLDF